MKVAVTLFNLFVVGVFLVGFARSLHGFRPGTRDAANRELIAKIAKEDPSIIPKKKPIEAGMRLPIRMPKRKPVAVPTASNEAPASTDPSYFEASPLGAAMDSALRRPQKGLRSGR